MSDLPGDRGAGPGPPRVWTWVLERLLPPAHREAAMGDAAEEFARRARESGTVAARGWYRRQVLRSVPPAALRAVRRVDDGNGEGMLMWMKENALALRTLLKHPGFTATVVLTLGIGVGATTALFGVFRAVFLEPIPLPDSDEIVVVMETASFGCCGPASWPDYEDWVERNRVFSGMATISPGTMTLTGDGPAERVYGTRVTASAFDLLGVAPLVGRALLPEDVAGDDVVVLSHRLWQRLGADPDMVGSTLRVDGTPRTVVGIMPPDFDVPSPWALTVQHQLYVPFPQQLRATSRGSHSFPVIARLAEGNTVEDAQADMDRVMRELAEEYPQTNEGRGTRVSTVHDYLYGGVGSQLGIILGAAGLVLLIACGNIAGLQLARAAGRETELAVRAALGASRWATVRLLFTESLLLSAAGGLVGVGLARVSVSALKAWLPPTMPRVDRIAMDLPVLAFALGAALLTAVLFGMLPALVASRADLASGVREGGYGTLAPKKERLRDYFIMGQIAIGLVLANGAALLVRSYAALRGQEYGFDTEEVLTMSLNPGGPRYPGYAARQDFYEEISRRVAGLGPVEAVGTVSRLPLRGGSNGNVLVEGRGPRQNSEEGPLVEIVSVTGDYFTAMGIPLLRGRTLEPGDSATGAIGVVINRTMAEGVWPGEDPIGKRFSYSDTPPVWLTVVGVVGDVRQWGPEQPPLNQAYVPFSRGWTGSTYLVVRSTGDPMGLVPEVRDVVAQIDPDQPPSDVRVMADLLERSFAQRRFYTTLIGLFALAALFLASAGIYGTVSYFVARRTRELGVRMALGAGGTGIMRLVLRRGMRLALWGVAIGLLGVWGSGRVVESLVYGVAAGDVPTLLAGCAALAGVAVAASGLPALRAVRLPPVLALRSE